MSRLTSLIVAICVLALAGVGRAVDTPAKGAAKNPVVVIETSMGAIEAELYPDKAPVTVKNFLDYVKAKQYDGLVFHRVIPGFMIQGGGFTADLKERKAREPIKNESDNGLKNDRGTLAMARTPDPDSATDQFFINLVNNNRLDRDQAGDGVGYAVFGKVTRGIEVVDKIAKTPTGTKQSADGQPYDDVPLTPVVIKSIRLKTQDKAEKSK